MKTKQTVRGERKWYVDFDKCIPYFGERLGCALCMVVCPWSRPGVAGNLAAKLARRSSTGSKG
jgi:Fe-S-cluster-containing hydrogenase component 2